MYVNKQIGKKNKVEGFVLKLSQLANNDKKVQSESFVL